MKNGVKLIPFEGDGVLVRVPVEVVKDWNIKAEDQIETDISWVGSDVSVKISKNGKCYYRYSRSYRGDSVCEP